MYAIGTFEDLLTKKKIVKQLLVDFFPATFATLFYCQDCKFVDPQNIVWIDKNGLPYCWKCAKDANLTKVTITNLVKVSRN